jgi:hypothetical protein
MAQPAELWISLVTLVFRPGKLGCTRLFDAHSEWRLVKSRG